MEQTEWPSQSSQGRLNRADAELYLTRLDLPRSLLDSKPSLELLRRLQTAHICTVPFESTTIHVPDWQVADDTPIVLNAGGTVGLGRDAFRRIIEHKRGGYCFSLNSTFALLLRYFDFRVSEVVARVFAHLGADPAVSGWDWSATTHQCAIVDWEGSNGRFLVDVGFGSTQPLNPIPFHDGATIESIPSSELYRLRLVPALPSSVGPAPPDPMPYYIMEHRDHSSEGAKEFWSPVYAFMQHTVHYRDFVVFNSYSSNHPSANFTSFFVATVHRPNGDRRTLYWKQGMERDGKAMAKLQTMGGPLRDGEELGKRQERDVAWVEFKVGPVKSVLEREFGFRFPSDYAGN